MNTQRQTALDFKPTKLEFTFMPFADKQPVIKAYYKHELAELYGISKRTFYTWIKPFQVEMVALGYKNSVKVLTPNIVKLLFEKIGTP